MNLQNLNNLRESLLKLHKELLEYEKFQYESKYGKVSSPGTMLGLVMNHADFSWLRQISELIVAIDELMESKNIVPEQQYLDLIDYSKKLLNPDVSGNVFEKKYYEAIHGSPAVALAHSKVRNYITNTGI